MLKYFFTLFQDNSKQQQLEQLEKNANVIYNFFLKNPDLAIKELQSNTEYKTLLSQARFYNWESSILDSKNNKIENSLLAALCRHNEKLGIFILSNKDLYSLLHENDMDWILQSEVGEKLVEYFKNNPTETPFNTQLDVDLRSLKGIACVK